MANVSNTHTKQSNMCSTIGQFIYLGEIPVGDTLGLLIKWHAYK